MDWPRTRSRIIVAIGLCLASAAVRAQDYRPDADGYPCAERGHLTIVPRGRGFTIEPMIRSEPAAAKLGPLAIAIGTALKLDARILTGPIGGHSEVAHAPRR